MQKGTGRWAERQPKGVVAHFAGIPKQEIEECLQSSQPNPSPCGHLKQYLKKRGDLEGGCDPTEAGVDPGLGLETERRA